MCVRCLLSAILLVLNGHTHGYTGRSGGRSIDRLTGQAVKEGSPVHPSYPSGHAVQNGAFATFLKVNKTLHGI